MQVKIHKNHPRAQRGTPAPWRRALGLAMYLVLPWAPTGWALDRNQAMTVNAGHAQIDYAKGVSVYRGNVVVTQGDTRLTADTIRVFGSPKRISKIVATGNPTTYHQAADGKRPAIDGSAKRIELYGKDDLVVFTEEARLQQNETTFTSDRIEYDARNKKVKASARVTIVIPGQGKQATP